MRAAGAVMLLIVSIGEAIGQCEEGHTAQLASKQQRLFTSADGANLWHARSAAAVQASCTQVRTQH